MTEFYTEPGYAELSPTQKAHICNGAGAANDWRSHFISNRLYWLDCTEVFNLHDYAYFKGRSDQDKARADTHLLLNLLLLIDNHHRPHRFIVRYLRRLKAIDYYTAVKELGHDAFWAGK